MSISHYSPCEFDKVCNKVRDFFRNEVGYTESFSQNRLSILAACEDPTTMAVMNYNDQIWPLPQTQQMWLEVELLKNPEYNGLFSVGTSFRDEKTLVEGRHNKIFAMLEFEEL